MLRCPECEARREGVFEQAVVEELDEQLDQATGALLSDLKQLTQANMEDEVEFFIRALDADLIVPSDFYLPDGLALLRGSARQTASATCSRRAPATPRGTAESPAAERSLGLCDQRQSARSGLLERAGGGDPLAELLGLARAAKGREVDPGKLTVALAREDQRQRDGAVEQVRSARLAGALDRPGYIQHVIQDLESQPDPPGEGAERVREIR